MLKIARILIITICCILICVLGTVYSFIRFRNPSNVGIFARWFGRLHPLFGLKVEHRYPANVNQIGRCIYIGNHQNNYDMVTISYMVMPRTVSVGKKSLIWVPFFGILYWATGNIFLDRDNRSKAHNTMTELARIMADLGCQVAYNLDGGGSSAMYWDGRIINRPSNGGERATSDILYIAQGA